MGSNSSTALLKNRMDALPAHLTTTARGVTVELLTEAHADEAAAVLTRSFGLGVAEPCFAWVMGPGVAEADRLAYIRFFQKWSVLTALRYGALIGARDADGKLLGVVCALRPGKTYAADATVFSRHFLRTLKAMRFEGPSKLHAGAVAARSDVMFAMMSRLRKANEAGLGAKPWYVWVLGVDADAQGNGCGRALMDVVHVLADDDRAATILETSGARNVAIYGRLGYRVHAELRSTEAGANAGEPVLSMVSLLHPARRVD